MSVGKLLKEMSSRVPNLRKRSERRRLRRRPKLPNRHLAVASVVVARISLPKRSHRRPNVIKIAKNVDSTDIG